MNKLYCALGYLCNNNCRICVVDSVKNKNNNLSTKDALSFFEVLNQKKHIQEVEFSGGEPTVRTDFHYILNHIHTNFPQIKYTVLSNGMLFSNISYVSELSKYPIKNIIIALHGCSAESHDWQTRTKGSFIKTSAGIKNLFDFGINTTLKIIITKKNYKEIPHIIEYISNNFPDCRKVTFNGIDIRGQALKNKEDIAISFNKAAKYVQCGIDKAIDSGFNAATFSIPACVFDEEYRKYVGDQRAPLTMYKSPFHEIDNKKEEHGTTKKCFLCSAYPTCSGAWNSYFEVMGLKDIRPIHSPNIKTTVVGINGSCNNNCIFCSFGGSRADLDCSANEVIQKIGDIHLKKNDIVVLSGGEPTKQKNIELIISNLRKRGIIVAMISNARRFSDFYFSKKLADAGLKTVTTEIHSSFPELHDFITQRQGSFHETINGIKNLISLGIDVDVKIVLMRANYKNAPQTVEFVCKNIKGIKKIMISATNIKGNALKNKELAGVRFSDAIPYVEKSIDISKEFKINLILDTIPLCVLNTAYAKYAVRRTPHNHFEFGQYKNTSNYLTRSCMICKHNSICSGVWKGHIDLFGEYEIKPVVD